MADEHARSVVGVLPPFKASISVVFPDPPHIKEKLDTHFSVNVGEAMLQEVLLTCLTSLLKKVMLNLPEDNMKTALEVVKRFQAMKVLASTGSSADSLLLHAGTVKDHSHDLFPQARVSLAAGYQHRSVSDLPVVSEDDAPSGESGSSSWDLGSFASRSADLKDKENLVGIRRANRKLSTAPAGAFRLRDPSDQLKACIKDAVARARSNEPADLQQQIRASTDSTARPRRRRRNLEADLFKSEPLSYLPSIEEDLSFEGEGQPQASPTFSNSRSRSNSTPASEEFAVGEDIVAPRAPTKAGNIHSTPRSHSLEGCPGSQSEVAAYFKELR